MALSELTSRARTHAKPLAGAVIVAAVAVALPLAILSSCPADPLHGGGELRTTGAVNATVTAPTFVNAGIEISGEVA